LTGGPVVKITKAIRERLGTLVELADRTVAEVIRARGGVAANVRAAGPWADRPLGEAARAAVRGDRTAGKAIKIAKNAHRLGRKFGGDAS
jgi:hypothetical protein